MFSSGDNSAGVRAGGARARDVLILARDVFSQLLITCLSPHRAARGAAMALSKLSADEHGIILSQLCNVLEPRLVMF